MTAEQLALHVKRVLTENTDRLISEIKDLMDKKGLKKVISHKDQDSVRIGRSQFQTLMRIAKEAGSLDELILWLSYQEAKNVEIRYNREDRKSWALPCAGNNSAAQHVIASLKLITEEMLKKIQSTHSLSNDQERAGKIVLSADEERTVKLVIAEKYLGYLYWQATVTSKGA